MSDKKRKPSKKKVDLLKDFKKINKNPPEVKLPKK